MASPADSSPTKSSTGAWLALAGIFVLGGIAVSRMFADRFDSGSQYPPYSTMRTDPFGTRALFEALDMMPGVEVVRNFDSLHKLARDQRIALWAGDGAAGHKPADARGQALVLAGLTADEFQTPTERTQHLERFVRAGGRLILALDPDGAAPGRLERDLDRALDELDEEDEVERRKVREEKEKKDAAKDSKAASPEPSKPEPKAASEDKTKSPPKPAPAADSKADKDKKRDRSNRPRHSLGDRDALSFAFKASIVKEPFKANEDGGGIKLDVKAGLPLKPDEVPEWFSRLYIDDNPKQDWTPAWSRRIAERLKKKTDKKDAPTKPEVEATPAPAAEKTIITSEPSPWKPLASKGSRPTIMQRSLGAGTIILCTDRFFLSNEALWKNAKPTFISWLLGDAKTIIFDETHLGAFVGDEDGVMTLARRYHMHGLFLGGILLFALYIWRNAFSLVPSSADDDLGHWRSDAVAGQSTASGLEGLLRRGVKFGELLPRCFAIWSGTRAAAEAVPPPRRAQAEALLADPTALKSPVSTYRRIRDALHPSKKA